MKQPRPAAQILPDRQAQFLESQPAPVGPRFGIERPHRASKDDRANRHRLLADNDAREYEAVGPERARALYLYALRAQIDHVDRATRSQRGLRQAERFSGEPRF